MDFTTKKFTITLPTLLGILSVISTIIAGYWYFKNTIETTKSGIVSANDNYKELKAEIQTLRDQMYEIAIIHNRNVQAENEIHTNYRSNRKETRTFKVTSPTNIQDTIDLLKMKKSSLQIKKIFTKK